MISGSPQALRAGAAALVALLVLELFWHAWLAPTSRASLALAVLPLLPALWLSIRRLRRGVLIGGIVCLFYFCHGIASLWNEPALRVAAALEVALSIAVIAALYWDARGYRRRTGPTDR
jgi:uncharacterized membrane protein